MAYLIKPNLKPQKWLLLKHLNWQAINELISGDNFALIQAKCSQFEALYVTIKDEIRKFNIQKAKIINTGINQGIREYKINLIIEVILLLINWEAQLKKEAQLIAILANQIAANITNNSKLVKEPHLSL